MYLKEVSALKVRIKFKKYGVMKYIGHLDMMRYFQKSMRRAEIPIAFSAGFSPHMIMSFANPLGVGLTSEGEYFDIEITESISSKRAVDQLNAVMVEGVEVTSFVELPEGQKTGMAIVAAADYRAIFQEDTTFITEEELQEFLACDEIMITKKSKKSVREVNIRPLIYQMNLCEDGIFMQLASGSVENLKPELVIDALVEYFNMDKRNTNVHYLRMEVYAWNEEHDQLVTLESLGNPIVE